MIRILALTLLCLVTALPARAETALAERFAQASRLYEEGKFEDAIAAYQTILEQGMTHRNLEYNLANAYVKAGRLGPAILHYRRALREDPTFENAVINLEYVRSLTRDVKSETAPLSPWRRIAALRLGPARAALGLFLTVTACCAVGVLRLRSWRGLGWPSWLQGSLGAVALLLGVALLLEWSLLEGRREGVVMAPEIEVRTGPDASYTVSFRLHEGTEVDVLRESEGWTEVRVSPELQGWLPADAVTGI